MMNNPILPVATIQGQEMPWLDFRLTEETMNHLWNSINHPIQPTTDAKKILAGNISKSETMQDTDNWFFENVLKKCIEYLYYKDWNNHYNVHVVKFKPSPKFYLKSLWVNYQKQHEFNPPHNHSGGIGYSFVVFMRIPTHWKEQHALPWLEGCREKHASNFCFLLGQPQGQVQSVSIPLSPEDEGRILFFPAWLEHQVFPFYGTEEERVTISGNIMEQQWMGSLDEKEKMLEKMEESMYYMERQIKTHKEMIQDEKEKIGEDNG